MWPKSSDRGISLVEILVASGLALLLVGFFVRVLIPTATITASRSARSEIEISAAMALERIGKDLDRTNPQGVSYTTDGTAALAIHPISDVTADGAQIWSEFLVVYGHSREQLIRREWPPTPPTLNVSVTAQKPLRLTPPDLAELTKSETNVRSVASGVTDFGAASAGLADQPTQPLKIWIGLERKVKGGTESFRLERNVFLSN